MQSSSSTGMTVALGGTDAGAVVGSPETDGRVAAPGTTGVGVVCAGAALLPPGESTGRDTHAPSAIMRLKSKSSTYGFLAFISFLPWKNRSLLTGIAFDPFSFNYIVKVA
jgi:hypothetical protein